MESSRDSKSFFIQVENFYIRPYRGYVQTGTLTICCQTCANMFTKEDIYYKRYQYCSCNKKIPEFLITISLLTGPTCE